jgi:hypothetical protein
MRKLCRRLTVVRSVKLATGITIYTAVEFLGSHQKKEEKKNAGLCFSMRSNHGVFVDERTWPTCQLPRNHELAERVFQKKKRCAKIQSEPVRPKSLQRNNQGLSTPTVSRIVTIKNRATDCSIPESTSSAQHHLYMLARSCLSFRVGAMFASVSSGFSSQGYRTLLAFCLGLQPTRVYLWQPKPGVEHRPVAACWSAVAAAAARLRS